MVELETNADNQSVDEVPVKKRRLLRTILFVLALLVLLTVITFRLWFPRYVALSVLYLGHNKGLQDVPTFKELSASSLPGYTYQFRNILFEVPWSDFSEEKGTTSETLYFGTSTTRRVVTIFEGGFNELSSISSSSDPKKDLFRNRFQTNYDVYRAVENITPRDIHLLAPANEIFANSILLTLKAVIYLHGSAYEFSNSHGVRGFEYIRSATTTTSTVFFPDDSSYEIFIIGAKQDEVDAILSSLRFTDQASSTKAKTPVGY